MVVGNRPETCFLCPVSGVSKHMLTLREWSLGFLEPCQSCWFSNHLKGLTFLVLNPRDREPSNWFQLVIPREGPLSLCALSSSAPSLRRGRQLPLGLCALPSLRPLSEGAGSCTDSLPFPCSSVSRASFFHLWLWKSLNASLQFVFSENCSTRRYIFDVLVEGSELCILLLCRLDPPLKFLVK